MDSRFYEEEKERILAAVRAIMDHFPQYINECKLHWPTCYIHKTEMCEVSKKGENTYFQCFEYGCGHKEYSI